MKHFSILLSWLEFAFEYMPMHTRCMHACKMAVKYDCIFEPHWISTHDNVAADALSRGDMRRFEEFISLQYGRSVSPRRFGSPGLGSSCAAIVAE